MHDGFALRPGDDHEVAGLVSSNHDRAIIDFWVAFPSAQRDRGISPRNFVIVACAGAKADEPTQLRLQLRQHPPGLDPLQPVGVPVRDLGAGEHADDDDPDLDRNRHPVLRPQSRRHLLIIMARPLKSALFLY